MKRLGIILLVFSFLIITCSKEKEKEDEKIIFEGITMTTDSGETISQDTTDWRFDDNWVNIENSLFTEKFDHWCNRDTFNYSIVVYPNPSDGILTLFVTKPEEYGVVYRIVDKEFNVLYASDLLYSTFTLQLDLRYLNISNDIVRIYYKIIGQDCELNGHGDILFL